MDEGRGPFLPSQLNERVLFRVICYSSSSPSHPLLLCSLTMTSLRTPVPLWPLLSFRRALPALRLPSKRRRISTTLTASAPNPPFRVLLLGSDDLSCATLKALHEARDGVLV